VTDLEEHPFRLESNGNPVEDVDDTLHLVWRCKLFVALQIDQAGVQHPLVSPFLKVRKRRSAKASLKKKLQKNGNAPARTLQT
jgi:hypothetical protein